MKEVYLRDKIFSFDLSLLDSTRLPQAEPVKPTIRPLPDLKPLSCGFEHAVVVRNGDAYAMGVSASGCLGLGPLLSQSSPPRLLKTLSEMKVRVLSVSCGRRHTLAITDYGVRDFFYLTNGRDPDEQINTFLFGISNNESSFKYI